MNESEIIDAFSERCVSDRQISAFEFEDMACSLATLTDKRQLDLLPQIMIYTMKYCDSLLKTHYADMVIYRLMPQPKGWDSLIDEMNAKEVDVTFEWLLLCRDYPFATNCRKELDLATELFEKRSNANRK